MSRKHSEIAFVPKRTTKTRNGWPVTYFAVSALSWGAGHARERMTQGHQGDHHDVWKQLKKEGWRIVKVRVSEV